MANTFFGLTIASSGLNAANVAINTTAHNISNINTTGYSKQETVQEAAGAIRVYSTYGTVSTGVNVTSIDQLRSSYYDSKYMNAHTNEKQYATYENYTALLEDYLDEFNLEGFTEEYSNLFNAIEDLARDPSSTTNRTLFLNYANSICDYFNTLSANFSNVQKQANDEIRSTVDSINSIAERICSLNKQINTIEIAGGSANDLRDARALLMDELSGYINVTFSETDIGNGATNYKVYINSQELVDGYDYNQLVCTERDELRNASDISGLYDISWNNGLPFNMYSSSLTGSLKAAIDIANGNNESYEIQTLRSTEYCVYDKDGLRTTGTLDDLLKAGYDPEEIQTEYTYLYQGTLTDGTTVYDTDEEALTAMGCEKIHYADSTDMTDADRETYLNGGYEIVLATYESPYFNSSYKGVPFYQAEINKFVQTFADEFHNVLAKGDAEDDGLDGADEVEKLFTAQYGTAYLAASNIQVNPDFFSDLSLLPKSFDNTVGQANTDMAEALSKLKEKTVMNNGTFQDYLSSIVSVVAIDSSSAKAFASTYQTIADTIENQRLSVSGVDEDEEAVDLVKYQNAYNLSSKVISVMQAIYQKLIEETGV